MELAGYRRASAPACRLEPWSELDYCRSASVEAACSWAGGESN